MSKQTTITATSWPRHTTKSVETRKKDLVVRITDWTRDKEEPAYDVEVYIRGVYDWNESKSFTTRSSKRTKREAKSLAVAFASQQIAKHLI